jgi:hypothetical protein
MKRFTLQNIAFYAGIYTVCLLVSAVGTTLVYYTSAPNPKVHWWGLFLGCSLGLFVANTVVIPKVDRVMAKWTRRVLDQSQKS